MNKNIIKIFYLLVFFILGIGVVFAANNFFKIGENWDANVSTSDPANDNFTLSGRLDLEDSRSEKYEDGYRGKITGSIFSDLFGEFNIEDEFGTGIIELNENSSIGQFGPHSECGTTENVERYSMSGSIYSYFWGEMKIDSDSYFCSNQYTYLKLKSDSLGTKESGTGSNNPQGGGLVETFDKQEIAISGIVNITGETGTGILNRGEGKINTVGVSVATKSVVRKNVNKNVAKLFNTYSEKIEKTNTTLNSLNSAINNNGENYYLYDYLNETKNINFSGSTYINNGQNLEIKSISGDKIEIDGKHTIVVKSGNIYINSNLYNKDDKDSMLIIVVKRDKNSGKGGNIYIDADVTNIDAILIADGSILSIDNAGGDLKILSAKNNTNNLRRQLLIYGSVLSSNNVGTDSIPYGADYYQDTSYSPNKDNIFDLGNIRTFNVNYGSGDLDGDGFDDDSKLVPISDSNGGYLENAWAGKCSWFNGENCDSNLRKSTKRNPLIIEYNSNVQILSPFIVTNNK